MRIRKTIYLKTELALSLSESFSASSKPNESEHKTEGAF